MAAQTMSGILARFETVLQAPPLNLVKSTSPFDDADVPNTLTDMAFRVLAGGIVSDVPTTNYASLRLDRVTVSVGKMLAFDGYGAQRAVQDLLDTIEQRIVADGIDHGYFASLEKGSRKSVKPKNADICQASISFLVDYDYSEAS